MLIVTVFGICVVDVWNGYKHHLGKNHRHKNCELMEMMNMMALDLIENRMSEDLVIQSKATSILVPPAEISTSSQTTISPLTAGLSNWVAPEVVTELNSMKHHLIATDEYMKEPRMTQDSCRQTAAIKIRIGKGGTCVWNARQGDRLKRLKKYFTVQNAKLPIGVRNIGCARIVFLVIGNESVASVIISPKI